MDALIFRLKFTAEEYLPFYRGDFQWVVVRSEDGRRVKFPAEHLRPFVTEIGIHGRFCLQFDRNNKFVGLKRIGD